MSKFVSAADGAIPLAFARIKVAQQAGGMIQLQFNIFFFNTKIVCLLMIVTVVCRQERIRFLNSHAAGEYI